MFLIALNGAMFWAVELLKEINLQCKLETIHAKSYGNAMQSDGNVSVMYNNMDLENKDIIIIEDIVDTGYTMQKLLETINIQKPKSVAIAALITKPEKIVINIKIDYLGFAIPPEFIIGCGMDYKEFGRNLRGIYRLKDNKNSEI
ncbi:Hypoxanthine phosphoribosyltransferase [bioreactor metagenome]|uniref:Hypoxanthine phosphoribosyltransferase n=1 Tax=bioreactor metagenome TaxID=1076179 RepID=A0A645C8U0_9ZZZZ